MSILNAIILGAIQGITEFLPVSSSAHLMFIPKLLDLPYQGKEFDIFLNLGSLFAILLFFRKQVLQLLLGIKDVTLRTKTSNAEFFITMFWSSLPAICLFGIFEIAIGVERINSTCLLSASMIIFGIVLYLCDARPTTKRNVSRRDSILTGLTQFIAVVPGVSRLGSCLSVMRYLGYSRLQSFQYSMLLSIPQVAGACFLKTVKLFYGYGESIDWNIMFSGCLSAFVFGLIALKAVSVYMKYFSLLPIVVYRIILGIILYWFL